MTRLRLSLYWMNVRIIVVQCTDITCFTRIAEILSSKWTMCTSFQVLHSHPSWEHCILCVDGIRTHLYYTEVYSWYWVHSMSYSNLWTSVNMKFMNHFSFSDIEELEAVSNSSNKILMESFLTHLPMAFVFTFLQACSLKWYGLCTLLLY